MTENLSQIQEEYDKVRAERLALLEREKKLLASFPYALSRLLIDATKNIKIALALPVLIFKLSVKYKGK